MTTVSPGQLIDEITTLLGSLLRSFNQHDFPDAVVLLLDEIHKVISENISVLNVTSAIELQLKDSLIDLQGVLKKYKVETNDLSTPVGKAVQQKNFAAARVLLKAPIYNSFVKTLEPSQQGIPAPSTVWPRSYSQLKKMFA